MSAGPIDDAPRRAKDTAKQTATKASRSPWMKRGARAGYVVLGVLHLVLGWLVIRMGTGDGSSEEASQGGALAQIAEQPFGTALLGFAAVALIALAVWQIIEAVASSGAGDRLKALGKAAVYLVLTFMAGRFALGMGGGDTDEQGLTARAMSAPAGRWLVAAVGIGILIVGIVHIVRGWKASFVEDVDTGSSPNMSRAVVVIGQVGYIAKGVALGVLGALFVTAAVQADPQEAGGLDQAFAEIGSQPFGGGLLIGVGVGLGCYGLFSIVRARGERM